MRTGRIKPGYGMIQRDIMTSNIDVYSKAVYCLLVSYAGDKVSCFPSLSTICKDLKISKPTVIKALKELIALKYIVADKRKTKSGDFTSNIYYPMYVMEDTDDPSTGVVNDVYHVVNENANVVNQVDTKKNKEEELLFNNNNSNIKEPVIKFKVPPFEEVEQYFKLLKKEGDAAKFYDFYTSKGWMVGRNKMKDWPAAARNFVKSNNDKEPKGSKINGVQDMMKSFMDI